MPSVTSRRTRTTDPAATEQALPVLFPGYRRVPTRTDIATPGNPWHVPQPHQPDYLDKVTNPEWVMRETQHVPDADPTTALRNTGKNTPPDEGGQPRGTDRVVWFLHQTALNQAANSTQHRAQSEQAATAQRFIRTCQICGQVDNSTSHRHRIADRTITRDRLICTPCTLVATAQRVAAAAATPIGTRTRADLVTEWLTRQ